MGSMRRDQQLIDLGWRSHTSFNGTVFCKLAEGVPECNYNNKSPQFVIEFSWMPSPMASVSIRGETKDGQWVRLESYSIPLDELLSVLDRECERLKKAWIAVYGEEE